MLLGASLLPTSITFSPLLLPLCSSFSSRPSRAAARCGALCSSSYGMRWAGEGVRCGTEEETSQTRRLWGLGRFMRSPRLPVSIDAAVRLQQWAADCEGAIRRAADYEAEAEARPRRRRAARRAARQSSSVGDVGIGGS